MKFPLCSSQVGKSQIRIQTSSTNSWPRRRTSHTFFGEDISFLLWIAHMRTYIYLHQLPKPAHKISDILCLDLGPCFHAQTTFALQKGPAFSLIMATSTTSCSERFEAKHQAAEGTFGCKLVHIIWLLHVPSNSC